MVRKRGGKRVVVIERAGGILGQVCHGLCNYSVSEGRYQAKKSGFCTNNVQCTSATCPPRGGFLKIG